MTKTGVTRATALLFGLVAILAFACQAEAAISVVGGLSCELTVEPGKTYRGVIYISNNGDEPSDAKVYQTDYLFSADGKVKYGDPGKDPRSNADWITFDPPRITVPPKETVSISYSVKVPDDDKLVGTYWSMLMVEGVKEPAAPIKGEKGKVKIGIQNVMRYGVQMVTQIGDTGTRELKITNPKLVRKDNQLVFQTEVADTGQRWLKPAVWVDLYNENGEYAGRFEGRRLRLFPETAARAQVSLNGPPPGTYKALFVADAGANAVFGVTYTLKLDK